LKQTEDETTMNSSGRSEGRLAGKVAIVTGAGSGIGEETAAVMRRDGAEVIGCDLKGSDVELDVTDGPAVERLMADTFAQHGRIDILANIAGVDPSLLPLGDETDADFDRALNVNLKGPFLTMRAVIPRMLENGGGAIVNVTSVGALFALPGTSSYCAAKAGLASLTRSVALEYGSKGIRANSVAPGTTRTKMVQMVLDEDPGLEKRFASLLPIGRLGEPGEIAEMIAMLASPAASFVSGVNMPIDGGWLAGVSNFAIEDDPNP
jgi:NAD(P)-dependent dehydrogenase (short-subunit alcohol dehydrogenase family)